MIVAIIDFETTGLDPETCEITEVATVLYDWAHDEVLRAWTRFVRPKEKPNDDVVELTGITPSVLERFGVPPTVAFMELRDQFYDEEFPRPLNQTPLPQFFVGHNWHNYDSKIFKRYWNEYFPNGWMQKDIINIPGFDTMTDLPYPKSITTRKLTHLNMEYGYLMKDAHRALNDCFGCVNLLRQFPIDVAMEWFNMPVYSIVATVLEPWFDKATPKQSEIAKLWGFKFNSESKEWSQQAKEIDYFRILNECPLEMKTKQLSFRI